jgi:hypothetical protein
MSDMTTIEAKAYVPAEDFALSNRFYQDLGFEAYAVFHGTHTGEGGPHGQKSGNRLRLCHAIRR